MRFLGLPPPERDVRCKAGQSRKLHKLVKGHVLLLQKTGIRHFPDGHLPPEPQTVPKQHGLAVERLHVKRLAAGQGMCRRQRKEEMLLPVFRAGYARLLDRMRQDDQLVNAVPQSLEQHLIFPHLRGDRPVRVEIRQNLRYLPKRRGRARADEDRPPAAVKGLNARRHVPRFADDPAGVFHSHPAVVVEFDLVFLPVKQRNPQRRLQPLHRTAEGALDTGKGHHDPEAPGVAEMLLQNFKVHD